MKKTLVFMVILAVFASGCKKKNEESSTTLKYSDSNPIQMVFQGPSNKSDHKIQVTSDYSITYTAINSDPDNEVITVSGDGVIHGKNTGTAKVRMTNGYETKTVDVKVNLFKEPTFDFGCSKGKIRSLYGTPNADLGDTIMVYGAKEPGVSFACWRMDFFFSSAKKYYASDVYICAGGGGHPDFSDLLEDYLDESFIYDSLWHYNDTTNYYMYHNIVKPEVKCAKIFNANSYGDICLMYFEVQNSRANVLNILPRSSKFLY